MTNITKEDFARYRDVQMNGDYNMLDPRAQQATGLSEEKFMAIIEDYENIQRRHDPTLEQWLEEWECEVRDGQSSISRSEAIRRWEKEQEANE